MRIRVRGHSFDTQDPRKAAKWKSALHELERLGLVESSDDENFLVTSKGFDFADGQEN